MAFCGNCGAEVLDNSEFCGKCGQKMNNEGSTVVEKKQIAFLGKIASLRGNKKVIRGIIVIVVIVIILVVSICVWKNSKKKVDLNNCISVEFSGYDTVGKATVDFDEEKFARAVLKAQGQNVSDSSSDYYFLMDVVETEVTPADTLKNGDEVTLKITYDNEVAKDYGIKFVGEEQTYTVEGLEEIKEVDPFENLSVTFSGVAPNVYISIENNSNDDYVSGLYFTADKTEGINVGDKITVSVNADKDIALQSGYKITQTSKEYTCDSADEYVSSCADIDDATLESLQKETIDHLDAYFAGDSDYISNSGWNYEGAYILTAKSISDWGNNNYVYIVYSTTVSSAEGDFDPTVVYIPVEFSELIKAADGSETFNADSATIQGSTDLQYDWFSPVPGYTDGATMFNDLMVASKADYTYDVSEGLQQFGK